MALITCPECGREISDKAVSCPGCGYPVQDNPVDERSDLERLVDEIYSKNKGNRTYAIKELMQKANMDFKQAKTLIQKKHNSTEVRAEAQRIKEERKNMQKQNMEQFSEACKNVQNVFSGSKTPHCPKCKSTSITYDTKKLSVTRGVVGYGLAGPAGAVMGGLSSKKGYAVCLNCGKRWKI